MTGGRRTIVAVAAAVAAGALVVAGTAAVVRAGAADYGIDLNLPALDESTPTGYWYPTVVNDTGTAIPDTTLDITVKGDPDAAVSVGNSPDIVRIRHEDTVPETNEKCRVPASDGGYDEGSDSSGAHASPTAFEVDTSMGCDQDLAAGDNVYSLWIGLLGEIDFKDTKQVSVSVTATLKADGTTLAAVTETLTIPARRGEP